MFCDTEPVFSDLCHIFCKSFTTEYFHRNFWIRILFTWCKFSVGTCNNCIQVSTNCSRFLEFKYMICLFTKCTEYLFGNTKILESNLSRSNIEFKSISGTYYNPVIGYNCQQTIRSFEIWLIETREPNMCVVRLRICVNVFILILVVFEPVHSLTIIDVFCFKINLNDIYTVVQITLGQMDSMSFENLASCVFRDTSAIHCYIHNLLTLEIKEQRFWD